MSDSDVSTPGDTKSLDPAVEHFVLRTPSPSSPSPKVEPFPELETDQLADPFVAQEPRFIVPVVSNYPAASKIKMTHHNQVPPRGDQSRIAQLQALMHGSAASMPVMGSDARYHDRDTTAKLDYGLDDHEDYRSVESDFAPGGAPIAQEVTHPQSALGRYMGVQPELEDLLPDDFPSERPYGFHVDNNPPFVNLARGVFPSTDPVLRLKNIPFGVSYSEIVMFMNKAFMIQIGGSTVNYPVHILMERSTGKTADAWLEMPDQMTADAVMDRYKLLQDDNKVPKLGNRPVNISIASQGKLMAEIFPRAKEIYWHPSTGIPIKIKPDFEVEPYSAGFQGFLTAEELYCTKLHSEQPTRAPFPQKALQRCYESIMATVLKYPWASPYFKMSERDELFEAYKAMLIVLSRSVYDQEHIRRNNKQVGLTQTLCTNFVNVGLRCPGFSERQKSQLTDIMSDYGEEIGMSRFCRVWPFSTMSIPPEVNDHDLEQWMELFDSGCLFTMAQRGRLAFSVDNVVELTTDSRRVWWVEDMVMKAQKMGNKNAVEYSFHDMGRAEEILMKVLMQRAWEQFFPARGYDVPSDLMPEPYVETQIEVKMRSLGVYDKKGIDRPEISKPGDDIVHIPREQYGAWRHRMQASTTQIPVKSLAEIFAQAGLPPPTAEAEAEHQRIQAQIRGVSSIMNPAGPSFPSGSASQMHGTQTKPATNNEAVARPGYGSMHPQATASFHTRGYSNITNIGAQDVEDQATPSVGIRSAYTSAFSAPVNNTVRITSPGNGHEVDFSKIAEQVIATKSVENTPQAKQYGSGVDPFAAPSSRSSQRGSRRADRESQESISFLRRRSKSPSKNSYTLSMDNFTLDDPPVGKFGAVGTPPRRAPASNTVVAAPTIPEGDEEEEWDTPSRSAKGKGRGFRG
ncbi:uncharacterized protein HMPREF1541_04399 [Cyphellophora europaea CBS 101466]|uniref:Uncharacterized protein n=1 Tax=Cyphellophora europaea (strain CBS 101466) TaxID=1220924 RepID=W2RWP5_CYPE1|nr:uncharacterized protein HMPREF1541_04399 [Cyphellophora europaea CBS 101466]ETN40124.1 hypothetical protein HMPREF1541_04399 [Cyphellophora europaea CBS 101466]